MVRLNPQSIRVLNQDGAPDAIHSVEGGDHVGAFLREARENTGRSVADVAQTLRIRRIYLEAIEDGRFDELPGAAYAVGFIRSYATYLRLDVATLVARFKDEASGIEAKQDLDFPTPVPEGRFPGGVVVTLCLMLTAAGLGGWYWWQNQNAIDVARVPPPPELVTGASDTPVAVTAEAPRAGDDEEAEVPVSSGPVSSDLESTDRQSAESVIADRPDGGSTPVASATQPDTNVAGEAAGGAPVAGATSAENMPSAEALPDASAPETATSAAASPAQTSPAETSAPDGSFSEASPSGTSPSDAAQPSSESAQADTPASSGGTPEAAPAAPPSGGTPVAGLDVPRAPNSDLNVGVALPSDPDNASSSAAPASEQAAALPAIPGAPAVSGEVSEGRTYGTVNRGARIVLSATDPDTWVQVMDSQQNALLTQMLRPGDRYLVPDRPGLSLQTNNAGGLDIRVDGQSVPTIGGRGEIRREVRLDPELLKSGAAVIQ